MSMPKHWWENASHHVQTVITTELRNGGPRSYVVRVEQAQKAAIDAYKAAFEANMLKGQVDKHVVQTSSFMEFFNNTEVSQVWKTVTKMIRKKKSA